MKPAQEVDVEVVLLVTVLTAHLAHEGVVLVVTAHVQRVHHLVVEGHLAVGTLLLVAVAATAAHQATTFRLRLGALHLLRAGGRGRG